eukprot:TRINITY_DN1337_c0_g1_i1.p1 TRINITY_DN1337_c0_g1~~TRINITY_DN1337_c0_g1_i1.p1  ORF type:complete len:272 (-),score=85.89 TRINITY_DN1337_c0_g1_i1:792-1607(-)
MDKEEEKQISIVVKNASSRFADVHLTIPLHWSVFQLKEELVKRLKEDNHISNSNEHQLKLIFGGQLLNNDSTFNQIFINSDTSISQNIYLVISSNPIGNSSSSPNSSIHFRFQARQQQQDQENNNNNPIRQQEERAQQPPRQEGENRDNGDGTIWTILKLAFMVYILSQGGGNARLAILCWIALVIFLVQTGRLRMFTQIPFNLPRFASGGGSVAPQIGSQQQKSWFQEVEQFIVPFFCSLFPNWQLPQSAPPQDQPQDQQEPQGLEERDE